MQKLAHILLKLDKIGSNVPKKYVTPAEVLLLVADHNQRAGGDAIDRLVEVLPNAEEKPLAELEDKLIKLEADREKVESDTEITDEIRQKRLDSTTRKISVCQDQIAQLQHIIARRRSDAPTEKLRLVAIYGQKRVDEIYPGAAPNFPETFESARNAGVNTNLNPDPRYLTIAGQ